MTERERLVELICNSTQHCLKCGCDFFDDKCKYKSEERCEEKRIADYLIESGVVILPCKVGDTVYDIHGKPIKIIGCGLSAVYKGVIEIPNNGRKNYDSCPRIFGGAFDTKLPFEFHGFDVGKTVFLTREEAEKALQERESE